MKWDIAIVQLVQHLRRELHSTAFREISEFLIRMNIQLNKTGHRLLLVVGANHLDIRRFHRQTQTDG